MTGDLAKVKKRLMVMLVVNGIAAMAAVAGAIGYFKYEQSWALIAFAVALGLGFGSQIWMIAGLRRSGRGA
jgi:hypothetical protein